MAGRLGGIRVKNWQDLTILAGYAPQENGPSKHKEHFWDQVTKTMAKLPRRTFTIFGGDLISQTTVRMSARYAKRRSSGARRPGLRGRCLQILAGKETRGEDTRGNKADPITFYSR